MEVVCPTKRPSEDAGQKQNSDRRPYLYSDKEGHFCPCSRHFLTLSIFDKFVDEVLILLNW